MLTESQPVVRHEPLGQQARGTVEERDVGSIELQVALDLPDKDRMMRVVSEVADVVDRIGMGTPDNGLWPRYRRCRFRIQRRQRDRTGKRFQVYA
jgi:hypothetical protein